MAMVHPSRMGLVPKDPPDLGKRGRSPSPPPRPSRRRSPSADSRRDKDEFGRDRAGKDRDREGDRDRASDERRSGYGDRSRRHDRDRARADDYFNEDKEGRRDGRDDGRRRGLSRSRSRSVDKERDRERKERRERERDSGKARRASPVYGDYRRPSPGRSREDNNNRDGGRDEDAGAEKAPWRQQENMYPNRGGRQPQYGGYGGGGGGPDFMDSRRLQREASTINVWPPSPKHPTRLESPTRDSKRNKKSSKRRRDDSGSDTDSDDSEGERRRRERKERKKARKEKKERERERGKDRDRDHRKHRSRSRRYSDDEDSDREQRRHRERTRSKSPRQAEERRSATRTRSPELRPPSTPDEDEWVEKPVSGMASQLSQTNTMPPPPVPASAKGKEPAFDDEDSDDDDVGPQPIGVKTSSRAKVDERQYGGALLRGEGSAMAAFLKDGTDVRIPRRGEIGLSSNEIARFEDVGYVMSGSRHRRMNAVRMRKENQVISAEEKRGILKLQQEERERREAILREEFQQLVQEKLKSSGAAK